MTKPVAIQVKDVAPFSKVTLYLSSAQRQVLRDALWDALENSADLTCAAPGDEVAQHISSTLHKEQQAIITGWLSLCWKVWDTRCR